MDITKKPYEISLWDDQLFWHRRKLIKADVTEDNYVPGKYYSLHTGNFGQSVIPYVLNNKAYDANIEYYQLADMLSGNYIEGNSAEDISVDPTTSPGWFENGKLVPQTVISFYKENRLCTIGSDTMTSLARCVNPKLTRKVNGEQILQFTMYYQYVDFETGKKLYNPFNKYMVNERKIKLRLGKPGSGAKWFDFVIKQIQEDSESKAFTYTCKSQFVNELSKSGFDLVLDNELENNMGTVDQLATTILEGSDWSVKKGDNLKQFIEEPLYRLKTFVALSAKNMETEASITIPAGGYIYAFYSHVNDKVGDLQFLYSSDDVFERDDKLVIDKVKYPNYITSGVTYTNSDWPDFTKNPGNHSHEASLSMDYRGMRLVRQIQTKYDSTIDKYVQVYKKKGTDDIYYGFTETDYISPTAVVNYVANPNGFITTTGWQATKNAPVKVVTYPELNADTFDQDFTSYLYYDCRTGPQLLNYSVQGFRSSIKGFQVGEEYVVRLKYKNELKGEYITRPVEDLYLAEYEFKNDEYIIKKKIFTFCENWAGSNTSFPGDGYIQFIAKCENSVSEAEFKNILKRYGLIFNLFNYHSIYIEDAQLFPCIRRSDGSIVLPGDEIFSEIKTTYKYYKPNPEWESIEDLILLDHGEEPNPNYIVQYNDGADAFTKVRSITAKESNRFNLLQDLNETFECWAHFEILHDQDTGEILLGKDVGKLDGDEAYRQQKFVTFKEYVGKRNYAGFRYGVNSKSIKRTIDSESIVSKLIVKDNVNEFAPNGFCSIARASGNPTRENFLINFDHYVQQGLLNLATVTNDLYLDVNGYIGYYKQLKRLNANREEKIDLQANLVVDIAKYSAAHQTYKVSYDAAVDERLSIESQIVSYIDPKNRPFASVIANKELTEPYKDDKTYKNFLTKWSRCKTIERQHEPLYRTAEINLKKAEEQYENITKELQILTKEKRALNLQFYKKYSRFIQEGSWNDENYVDDNLYYLDACSTLHTSAQPKVTYDISVLDLSQMPEYSGYDFDLGDITYIEDTEFFGWSLIDGKTPYKEEIIISEIVQELDEPEKNVIKVQNYKTQFEDLFQRITATTQSVEYHEGEYQRAAGIVQPNGMISASVLESSLANNAFVLSNAKDQSIIWDESGITATSINNTSEMVRLVSGGIFLSTDGGQTWRTGITASGINTSLLTAGQINADEINIMSGGQPAFRWDSKGLSAYFKNDDGKGYNLKKYVRFDQYGLYGINNKVVEINSLEDVHNNAHFALTWDKFLLRSAYGTGSITIDSEEHIVVRDDDNIRIKIGNIGDKENPKYGLLIKDNKNKLVMHTDDEGKMWISSALSIGESKTSTVQIGYLQETKEGTEIHQILRAGDIGSQFVVYEDGTITATAGIIGGIELGNFNTLQRLEVIMQNGDTFTTTGNQANPETLYFSASLEGFTVNNPATDIKWEGTDSLNNEWLLFGRGKDFVVNYKDLYDFNPDLEICYVRASATSNEKDSNGLPKVFSKIFAIKIYSDALKLEILSSNGNIFINKKGATTLTAKLYSGKDEVDAEELGYEFEWYKSDEPDRVYATGKTLTFDLENSEEIDYMGTYTCQVVQVQGGQNE